MAVFDVAIAAIFARELAEAMVIIGQHLSVVSRNVAFTEAEKRTAVRRIWIASTLAAVLAILTVLAAGIGLSQLHQEIDDGIIAIIEGVSKLVACICIGQFSLKIPKWFGIYAQSPKEKDILKSGWALGLNVAWNIWREIAEIGVFLIPYFIAGNMTALALSAFVGVVIALVPGIAIFCLAKRVRSPLAMAVCLSTLTGLLAVGLFAYGCHEVEEVLGETDVVYTITGSFWNQKKLPMAIFKPFGYSDHPTVLQVASWWCFAVLLTIAHAVKYYRSCHPASGSHEVTVEDLEASSTEAKMEAEEDPHSIQWNMKETPTDSQKVAHEVAAL